MKIPAVTIDVADDGTAYTVTALPWPTIESSAQPFIARLVHTHQSGVGWYPGTWTADRLGAFIKKLMATYPKVNV